MMSHEIADISSWIGWSDWNRNSTRKKPGLYVFRLPDGATVHRVKGTSDILYIGCSVGELRARLMAHKRGDTSESVLLKLIQQHLGDIEIGWADSTKGSAYARESDLVAQYASEHIEFPPANNQQPARAGVDHSRGASQIATYTSAHSKQSGRLGGPAGIRTPDQGIMSTQDGSDRF